MRAIIALFVWVSAISVYSQTNLDVGGIRAIRFASGTSLYSEQRDGVLEVDYNGVWGTICNYGFDEVAASVACFMLGFPPRGVAILNSQRVSPLGHILSNFNCSGRVSLPNSTPSTATFHLGVCSFSTYVPLSCTGGTRQTSVICLDPPLPKPTTSTTPSYVTIPPVDCSSTSSSIRLVHGTNQSGRVEIKHPVTDVWGTICADGFDIYAARALCRMMCVSADNLQHAYPVLYKFGSAPESVPIHLARIRCPPDAASLNNCDLGGGWGSTAGCTHGMDVGLQCGPSDNSVSPKHYEPQLICNSTNAVVRYAKLNNSDLTPSMIKLHGDIPLGCAFTVVETTLFIEAIIPLQGCGGNLTMSNDSAIAIQMRLVREFNTDSNGIIAQLPVLFTITCLIPRTTQTNSQALISPELVRNLINQTPAMSASLQLYQDQNYLTPLEQPLKVKPGQTVYALVSLVNGHSASKLILEKCWATLTENKLSTPQQNLIVNRCASYHGLNVIPLTSTKVGFTFSAFYLGNAGSIAPTLSNLFLHCDTRICDTRETTDKCQQFCKDPTTPSIRFRRSASSKFWRRSTLVNIESGHISVKTT